MSRYTPKDLEMPDDEPMVIIRSSLLWICDGDKYAAAALNMYVHWTRWLMKRKPVAQEINKMLKKKGQPPSQDTTYIIYRKQSLLLDDLLGFCSDRRLRQANDLLVSKGLLKIEDTPRYLTDHVLKYEVQIGTFKKLMDEWRKHREENNELEDDEEVEVSLEAGVDGTDNYPFRSGKKSAPSSLRNGKKSVPERKKIRSNNIDDKKEMISIDDKEREGTSYVSEPEMVLPTPSDNNSLNSSRTEEPRTPEPEREENKEIPLEQWPWNAEKALRIIETLVQTTYKSRDVELKACVKILDTYHPTEDIYIRVALKILPWYKKRNLLLRPTHLSAKNGEGKVRFEELLEEIEYVERQDPGHTEASQKSEPVPSGMTQAEAEALVEEINVVVQKQICGDLKVWVEPVKNSNGWMVKGTWDGQPTWITKRSEWLTLFAEDQEYRQECAKKTQRSTK